MTLNYDDLVDNPVEPVAPPQIPIAGSQDDSGPFGLENLLQNEATPTVTSPVSYNPPDDTLTSPTAPNEAALTPEEIASLQGADNAPGITPTAVQPVGPQDTAYSNDPNSSYFNAGKVAQSEANTTEIPQAPQAPAAIAQDSHPATSGWGSGVDNFFDWAKGVENDAKSVVHNIYDFVTGTPTAEQFTKQRTETKDTLASTFGPAVADQVDKFSVWAYNLTQDPIGYVHNVASAFDQGLQSSIPNAVPQIAADVWRPLMSNLTGFQMPPTPLELQQREEELRNNPNVSQEEIDKYKSDLQTSDNFWQKSASGKAIMGVGSALASAVTQFSPYSPGMYTGMADFITGIAQDPVGTVESVLKSTADLRDFGEKALRDPNSLTSDDITNALNNGANVFFAVHGAKGLVEHGISGARNASQYLTSRSGTPTEGLATDMEKAPSITPLTDPAEIGGKVQDAALAVQAVKDVHDVVTGAGGQLHVTGGAVRDLASGHSVDGVKDFDTVGFGVPEDQLFKGLQEKAAETGGSVIKTGDNFPVYRYTAADGTQTEVAMPRTEDPNDTNKYISDHTIPVADDLGRRDFRRNAMSVDLTSGQLHDPHGGLEEIKNGTLDTVSPQAFIGDPARMLRAAARMSVDGVKASPQLLEQMREHAPLLENIPGERKSAELDKILSGRDPGTALKTMVDTGVLEHIIPEFKDAIGFDQNHPTHHLALSDHLTGVASAVAKLSHGDPDAVMSGLLHDLGKLRGKWEDKDGISHYYGNPKLGKLAHEEYSAQMAREILTRLKYSQARIDRIVFNVQNHQFGAFNTKKGAIKFLRNRILKGLDSYPTEVREHIAEQRIRDLMNLREADQDQHAVRSDGNAPRMRSILSSVMGEKAVPLSRKDMAINGHDLEKEGIVKPGPAMGKVLNDLHDRTLRAPGEAGYIDFKNRDDLLAAARQMVGKDNVKAMLAQNHEDRPYEHIDTERFKSLLDSAYDKVQSAEEGTPEYEKAIDHLDVLMDERDARNRAQTAGSEYARRLASSMGIQMLNTTKGMARFGERVIRWDHSRDAGGRSVYTSDTPNGRWQLIRRDKSLTPGQDIQFHDEGQIKPAKVVSSANKFASERFYDPSDTVTLRTSDGKEHVVQRQFVREVEPSWDLNRYVGGKVERIGNYPSLLAAKSEVMKHDAEANVAREAARNAVSDKATPENKIPERPIDLDKASNAPLAVGDRVRFTLVTGARTTLSTGRVGKVNHGYGTILKLTPHKAEVEDPLGNTYGIPTRNLFKREPKTNTPVPATEEEAAPHEQLAPNTPVIVHAPERTYVGRLVQYVNEDGQVKAHVAVQEGNFRDRYGREQKNREHVFEFDPSLVEEQKNETGPAIQREETQNGIQSKTAGKSGEAEGRSQANEGGKGTTSNQARKASTATGVNEKDLRTGPYEDTLPLEERGTTYTPIERPAGRAEQQSLFGTDVRSVTPDSTERGTSGTSGDAGSGARTSDASGTRSGDVSSNTEATDAARAGANATGNSAANAGGSAATGITSAAGTTGGTARSTPRFGWTGALKVTGTDNIHDRGSRGDTRTSARTIRGALGRLLRSGINDNGLINHMEAGTEGVAFPVDLQSGNVAEYNGFFRRSIRVDTSTDFSGHISGLVKQIRAGFDRRVADLKEAISHPDIDVEAKNYAARLLYGREAPIPQFEDMLEKISHMSREDMVTAAMGHEMIHGQLVEGIAKRFAEIARRKGIEVEDLGVSSHSNEHMGYMLSHVLDEEPVLRGLLTRMGLSQELAHIDRFRHYIDTINGMDGNSVGNGEVPNLDRLPVDDPRFDAFRGSEAMAIKTGLRQAVSHLDEFMTDMIGAGKEIHPWRISWVTGDTYNATVWNTKEREATIGRLTSLFDKIKLSPSEVSNLTSIVSPRFTSEVSRASEVSATAPTIRSGDTATGRQEVLTKPSDSYYHQPDLIKVEADKAALALKATAKLSPQQRASKIAKAVGLRDAQEGKDLVRDASEGLTTPKETLKVKSWGGQFQGALFGDEMTGIDTIKGMGRIAKPVEGLSVEDLMSSKGRTPLASEHFAMKEEVARRQRNVAEYQHYLKHVGKHSINPAREGVDQESVPFIFRTQVPKVPANATAEQRAQAIKDASADYKTLDQRMSHIPPFGYGGDISEVGNFGHGETRSDGSTKGAEEALLDNLRRVVEERKELRNLRDLPYDGRSLNAMKPETIDARINRLVGGSHEDFNKYLEQAYAKEPDEGAHLTPEEEEQVKNDALKSYLEAVRDGEVRPPIHWQGKIKLATPEELAARDQEIAAKEEAVKEAEAAVKAAQAATEAPPEVVRAVSPEQKNQMKSLGMGAKQRNAIRDYHHAERVIQELIVNQLPPEVQQQIAVDKVTTMPAANEHLSTEADAKAAADIQHSANNSDVENTHEMEMDQANFASLMESNEAIKNGEPISPIDPHETTPEQVLLDIEKEVPAQEEARKAAEPVPPATETEVQKLPIEVPAGEGGGKPPVEPPTEAAGGGEEPKPVPNLFGSYDPALAELRAFEGAASFANESHDLVRAWTTRLTPAQFAQHPIAWFRDFIHNMRELHLRIDRAADKLEAWTVDHAKKLGVTREELDNMVNSPIDVSDEVERQIKLNTLKGVSPEAAAMSEYLHQYWQTTGKMLQDKGLFKYMLANYLPHIITKVPAKFNDGKDGKAFDNKGELSKGTDRAIERAQVDGHDLNKTLADLESKGYEVERKTSTIYRAHAHGTMRASRMQDMINGFMRWHVQDKGFNGKAIVPSGVSRKVGPKGKRRELIKGYDALTPAEQSNYRPITLGASGARSALSDYMVYRPLAEYIERLSRLNEIPGKPADVARWIGEANGEFKFYKFAFNPVHLWNMLSNIQTLAYKSGYLGVGPFDPRLYFKIHNNGEAAMQDTDRLGEAVSAGFSAPRDFINNADVGGKLSAMLTQLPGFKQWHNLMWNEVAYKMGLGLYEHLRDRLYAQEEKDQKRPLTEGEKLELRKVAALHAKNAVGFLDQLDMTNDYRLYGNMLVLARNWTTIQARAVGNVFGSRNKLATLGGGEQYGIESDLGKKYSQRLYQRLVLGGTARLFATSLIGATAMSYLATGGPNGGTINTPFSNYQKDPLHTFDIYGGRGADGKDIWFHNPFYGFQREIADYTMSAIKAYAEGKNPYEIAMAPVIRISAKANPILTNGFEAASGMEIYRMMSGYNDPHIDADKDIIAIRKGLDAIGVPQLNNSLENRLIYAFRQILPSTGGFPTKPDGTTPATTPAELASQLGPGTFLDPGRVALGLAGSRIATSKDMASTIASNQGYQNAQDAAAAKTDLTRELIQAFKDGNLAKAEAIREKMGANATAATDKIIYGARGAGSGVIYEGLPQDAQKIAPKPDVLLGHRLDPQQAGDYQAARFSRQNEVVQWLRQEPDFKTGNATERQQLLNEYLKLADKITDEQYARRFGLKPGNAINDTTASGIMSETKLVQEDALNKIHATSLYYNASPADRATIDSEYRAAAQRAMFDKYFSSTAKNLTAGQISNMLVTRANVEEGTRAFVHQIPEWKSGEIYQQEKIMKDYVSFANRITENALAGKIEGGAIKPLSTEEILPLVQNSIALEVGAKQMLHNSSVYTEATPLQQATLDKKYADMAHKIALYDTRDQLNLNIGDIPALYKGGFGQALQSRLMADEGYKSLIDSSFTNGHDDLVQHEQALADIKKKFHEQTDIPPAQLAKYDHLINNWYRSQNPQYDAFLKASTFWKTRTPIGQLYSALEKNELNFASKSPLSALNELDASGLDSSGIDPTTYTE